MLQLTLSASHELLPETAIRELCDGWAAILAGMAAYAAGRPPATRAGAGR
jgi:hypothetical protein